MSLLRLRHHHHLFLPLLLLLTTITNLPTTLADENHYCGKNWQDAVKSCSTPCPTGLDSECLVAGDTCVGYTGCVEILANRTPEPTLKPTRRTKRPTNEPTTAMPTVSVSPTVEPTTGSPTGSPTGMPIVRPFLVGVETIQDNSGGGGDGTTILSTSSQRSYGIIFEVQTTMDSPAIAIQNLEFYSPLQNANVAYEVWTKQGTWHGFEGKDREFSQVASGNLTTSAEERGLTRIPEGQFVPIQIDGGGARQSIYLTLASKDLLYAHSTMPMETTSVNSIEQAQQQPTEDTVVLVETLELIVYEGAAIMTFPFQKAAQRIFYRMPRGFVGRIWYLRAPCEDVLGEIKNETDGTILGEEYMAVQKWEDCEDRKRPVMMPTKVQEMPTSFLTTDDDGGSTDEDAIVGGNITNGTTPTSFPTASAIPTILTMKINLILTLRNIAQNRIMTFEEQTAFEATAVEFYQGQELLELNEVEIYGSQVWYQQVFVEEIDGELDQRLLQDSAATGEAGEATETTMPSIPSLEVTLILSILYSPLPQQITQELLQTLLQNNSWDFLQLLLNNPTLSSHFQTIQGIPSIVAVDKVTEPPTLRPTEAPSLPIVSLEVIEEESTMPTWMYIAVLFGLLYVSLTWVSMCYVKHARQRMYVERQRRSVTDDGGGGKEQSATKVEGHGMRYDESERSGESGSVYSVVQKKNETKTKGKSWWGSFRERRSMKEKHTANRGGSSLLKKDNDLEENGNLVGNQNDHREEQYEDEELYPLEEGEDDGGSYYTEDGEEEEEEEDFSSMEDSYYSEEESDDYSSSGGSGLN